MNNRIIKGTQLTGEIPDVLLEQTPIACPPEKTQPFLLRINIPPEAEPGIYTGNLRILADDIPVADIPVRLNVWNFTLPEQPTLLSVLNPWPHRITAIYPDNAELRAKAYRQVRELTIDAHGVWLCRRKPEIEWDKDGNIVKFDTTAFDRELEEYFRQTRAKLAINSFARFGVGGAHSNRDISALSKKSIPPSGKNVWQVSQKRFMPISPKKIYWINLFWMFLTSRRSNGFPI